MRSEDGHLREFGSFRLDTRQKVLWHKGRPVPMPLKEIKLLCLLVENRGELVTKNEILETIWADSFVGESNLSRHIYLLRQTLKDFGAAEDLIENIPRRGYRFTGEISRGDSGTAFVIERHSLTKTRIDEFIVGDETRKVKRLSGTLPLLRSRTLAPGIVLVFVLAAGLAVWKYSSAATGVAPRIRSIAVLPFKTIDPRKQREDVEGLGLADVLITKMSGINGLTVRPLNAVMNFGDESPLSAGQKLEVDAVLEGTIYRTQNGVRITARLFSIRDKTHLWTGHFEKPLRDEFKMQNEIAQQLVNALSINLSQKEENTLGKEYTDNAEAYRLYLEGRYHWNKRSNPGMGEAERLFRNAIEKDPEFALAYVGLADTLGMLEDPKDAASAIKKALELDPDLAEAHAALGFSYMFRDWDWKNAEAEFKRSLELNPGYATAHQWYATLLSIEGRFAESGLEMERALEIHPTSYNFLADRGQLFYLAGDLDLAEEYCLKSLEIYPDFSSAQAYLADIYLLKGNYNKAIDKSFEYALIQQDYVNHTPENKALLSEKYANKAEAFKQSGIRSFLEDRLQTPHNNPNVFYHNAQIHAFLENREAALDDLEKAFQQKAFMLVFVKADPKFEKLRAEPRFREILRKMNLGE